MNAKETLKKLAEALNISTETVETAPEKAAELEAVTEAETVEEVKEETVEAVVAEVTEESVETEEVSSAEEIVAEVKEDNRVAELEKQLQDLKDILKKTIETPVEEAVTAPIDDKGLTHSPEKLIERKHTKIGKKGGDTMSRVFKYINN